MKIGENELQIPLIQGGMGIGISLGRLAGAVAATGAMGVISCANAGFRDPDFIKHPHETNDRILDKEIKNALSAASGKGMVAVNIMAAINHYEDMVKAAVNAGAQAIISGAGLPLELPKYIGTNNTAIAPIVSSGKAAKLICKTWDKKFGRIPDFIVIEGPGAGGHLGFKKEDIINKTAKSPYEILPEVLEAIKEFEDKYGCSIPVFLAGGIFDGHDMAKAMKIGAAGVQIGTRFIATEECDASEIYKKVIIDATNDDVVIVQSPVGMPGRALKTKLIKDLEQGKKLMPTMCTDCLKMCPHGAAAPYCISRALMAAASGDVDNGLFFCGENVGRINKMVHVSELVDEIWSVCLKELE